MANSIQKVTKKERYTQLLAIAEVASNPELVEFINHEMDLLAKKNANGEHKKTATQLANEELKNSILDAMEDDEKYTVTQMLKNFDFLANFSSSKVNALVTQLRNENRVERIVEGRVAYFIKN